jgi:hypothetical protein
MKVLVDVSIFSKQAGSFGNAAGELELPWVPQVGDTISFTVFGSDSPPPPFGGLLKVTDRVIAASGATSPSLALEDVIVTTAADARAVASYLETVFGLFVTAYESSAKD